MVWFVMLWVTLLLGGVLWSALGAAVTARMGRPRVLWMLWHLPIVVGLVLLIPLGNLLIEGRPWLPLAHLWLTLPVPVALMAAVIYVIGFGPKSAPHPTAATWSRRTLAVATVCCWAVAVFAAMQIYQRPKPLPSELRREARVLVQRAAPEPVAPEDNAAPVYRRALAAIQPLSWSWGYDEVPELSATQRAALDAELKANKPVFALLRKAAQRPRCDFHRNLTVLDLTQRERWELAYMRELGTLIRFRVELALFRGRIDAAIADWKLLHRLHEHLAEDCFQIGRLTGLALNQMSLEVWQTILLQEGLTARQAAAIDPGSSVDFVAMIVESLDVEEARVLSAIADYIDGRYVQSASPIQYGMIHWYRTLLFGREVREFREATAGLREAYRGYDSDQPAPWPGPFPKYDFGPVTQASSDIDFSLFKSALFAAMHQRCAAVALEIRMRELQAADGVPMSAAPDLTAIELPVDVFATPPGRKIQWNRERRIVYSIGYDREDNGGNDGDIVVKY